MQELSILVVEDDQSQREMLSGFLGKKGHHVAEAANGKDAITLVLDGHFDLLLLDYRMPEMDGMHVLREVKQINPEIDLVIMTAYGTIHMAVEAMKAGAADYITKPVDLEQVLILIRRIAEHRTLVRENEILREHLKSKGITAEQIICRSRTMAERVNLAGRVAGSNATVLLQGESGTGKELFARLIHTLSPRSGNPLVTVNCAALPEGLVESELFGHEKGAFTGAIQRKPGRVEQADGGTLFLDEIGELAPSAQAKLLRFLQEKEFERLGGNQTLGADVRIISATNKNLGERVKQGDFREDLFYRLNVVTMTIPALRERREDISLLIDHFLRRFSKDNNKQIKGISREAKDILLKYDYPGNVRELENILERAVVIARGSVISIEDLPFRELPLFSRSDPEKEGKPLKESVEALERRLILKAMEEAGHHQTKAAGILGISERVLCYKLKKCGLK